VADEGLAPLPVRSINVHLLPMDGVVILRGLRCASPSEATSGSSRQTMRRHRSISTATDLVTLGSGSAFCWIAAGA